ncbi:unnamed protein product [marine sediment metagenome]|uniref:Uncharacterized protein n=1 Tax=marine sediment metagenome TaxID=412755 RepID=X1THR3_9ZZZZ
MKLLSFRGNIESQDNARTSNQQIFSYNSPDLTRAWKVKSFYLWPKTVRAETGTEFGQMVVCASLATDEIGSPAFADIMDVTDNRQIGWISSGYNRRNAAVSDFLTRPTGIEDSAALMDPDHIVNRNLYINMYTTSDSTTSPIRLYNYLLILEEVKITENEAILQIVKGVAQDIRN